MRSKTIFILVTLVLLGAGVFWIVHNMAKSASEARIVACLDNLYRIGQAIEKYRNLHDGEYPVTLQELYPKYLESQRSLKCFADYDNSSTIANSISYIYKKPEGTGDSKQIIARDKTRNHKGMGGYSVLYANGSVEWLSSSNVNPQPVQPPTTLPRSGAENLKWKPGLCWKRHLLSK